jgi:hypothetical protein
MRSCAAAGPIIDGTRHKRDIGRRIAKLKGSPTEAPRWTPCLLLPPSHFFGQGVLNGQELQRGLLLKESAPSNQCIGAPHGKMHFMVTRGTIVDADMCMIPVGQRTLACHAHFFSAPTRGYAASGRQQLLNYWHPAPSLWAGELVLMQRTSFAFVPGNHVGS